MTEHNLDPAALEATRVCLHRVERLEGHRAMKVYPTSGECPICGVKLAPVLIDWTSDESPTGLSGGWRWVCSICESPKHQTEWAADVRKTRIDRRVQIRDLADQIGATSAGLCDIETGRSLPTDDQRSALDSWLAGSEAER